MAAAKASSARDEYFLAIYRPIWVDKLCFSNVSVPTEKYENHPFDFRLLQLRINQ